VELKIDACICGSGKEAWLEFDAKRIPLGYMCDDCRVKRLRGYRREVLTNPNYLTIEPVEPE